MLINSINWALTSSFLLIEMDCVCVFCDDFLTFGLSFYKDKKGETRQKRGTMDIVDSFLSLFFCFSIFPCFLLQFS